MFDAVTCAIPGGKRPPQVADNCKASGPGRGWGAQSVGDLLASARRLTGPVDCGGGHPLAQPVCGRQPDDAASNHDDFHSYRPQ